MSILKAFALAGVISLVALLMVGIQQYRIQTSRVEAAALAAQVEVEKKGRNDAVEANLVSQATISTLQAELQRNREYAADLDKRIKASEAKAKQARTDYEKLKKNSKPVRDWSVQPLPDGLRGKPARAGGGNKDNGAKARGA